MTVTTAPAHRRRSPAAPLAAEWTKLWSVRSTWWSLAGGLVLMLLLALSLGIDASYPPDDVPRAQAMLLAQDASALGMVLAQFVLIALATLVVTGEYASGSILSTLQGEPLRSVVLAAKVAVVAPVVFLAGTAMMLLGALVADLAAGDYGSLVLSDVVDVSLRTGLYVALASVLAMGIGFALRSTAGTLTTIFLLLMLLPMMLAPLDVPVVSEAARHLPGSAGLHYAGSAQMLGLGELPYGPTTGLVVLVGWALAALAAGYLVLRRRDV